MILISTDEESLKESKPATPTKEENVTEVIKDKEPKQEKKEKKGDERKEKKGDERKKKYTKRRKSKASLHESKA